MSQPAAQPTQALMVDAFFPFWSKLTDEHRDDLLRLTTQRVFQKGDHIHAGDADLGLVLLQSGQVRSYIISPEGKEVTLYRLFERDISLFSASCIMRNIQFEIYGEVERETHALVVPVSLYERLIHQSIDMSNFTNNLLAARFSDVMWTIEQILFKRMDQRVAQYLLDQCVIEGGCVLPLTHDGIARDLGTAREVITRMLDYLRKDGILTLSRGQVTVLDEVRLFELANE